MIVRLGAPTAEQTLRAVAQPTEKGDPAEQTLRAGDLASARDGICI